MAKMPTEYHENPFMVSEKKNTTSYTIPSMRDSNITYDVSISGYIPIGIVGYITNSSTATIRGVRMSNSTEAQIVIGNPTSASITINDIRLRVLYQKV